MSNWSNFGRLSRRAFVSDSSAFLFLSSLVSRGVARIKLGEWGSTSEGQEGWAGCIGGGTRVYAVYRPLVLLTAYTYLIWHNKTVYQGYWRLVSSTYPSVFSNTPLGMGTQSKLDRGLGRGSALPRKVLCFCVKITQFGVGFSTYKIFTHLTGTFTLVPPLPVPLLLYNT